MKIRLDYVTNSSSSSFLIALKNIENEEIKKKFNEVCGEWVKGLLLNGDKITTIEELNECAENRGWEIDNEEGYGYKEYIKSKELIEKGNVIIENTTDWQNTESEIIGELYELFSKLGEETGVIPIATDLDY